MDFFLRTHDTYYFSGGTINGFISTGGVFCISGGHFTDFVMFNNKHGEANPDIQLSGNAEFDRPEHMIYANDEGHTIQMTISDNAHVGAMVFDIMGDGIVNYPVFIINDGYFTVDTSTWCNTSGAGENALQISSTPEQYDNQTDWIADSNTYTWREKQPVFTGHSLSLNGDIGVNFYIELTEEQAAKTRVTFSKPRM